MTAPWSWNVHARPFLQTAVTGSEVEPLDHMEWGVTKWEKDRPILVALYGTDNIPSRFRRNTLDWLQHVIGLHEQSGLAVHLAGPGEKGDVNVFFPLDAAVDADRFRAESQLLTFDLVYDRGYPPDARCWERSLVWQIGTLAVSSVTIPIEIHEEHADLRLARCVMEELTHALSAIRRDLPHGPDSAFVDSRVRTVDDRYFEWSTLDHLLIRIAHAPEISHGDRVGDILEKFPTVYRRELAEVTSLAMVGSQNDR
ncbi:MAG: DUF2927 domain-containing protein [Alphaproteobacteria bacterium GM202ARS2]|nr:DUF2927 domain-containing protein [Alphaproteobacteria bacterium GM202ARS2]